MTAEFDFTGKAVLITGAAQGIGKIMAEEFARRKADLVLLDLNEERLSETAEVCRKLGSRKVLEIVCNLKNVEEIDSVPQKVSANFEGLDVLINNAGVVVPGDLNDILPEHFDLTFSVNLKAPLFLTKALMPLLEKSKGAVVSISSLTSTLVTPGLLIYSLSKAGINLMTKMIARECAPKGVRINCIHPAVAETPLPTDEEQRKQSIEFRSHHRAYQPLDGLIKPKNITRLAMFLASDSALQITGQSHVIDAGHRPTKEAATPITL